VIRIYGKKIPQPNKIDRTFHGSTQDISALWPDEIYLMNRIALLKNPIQDYAWGSTTFIPWLMGRPGPAARPQAELWMGAHPRAPSRVLWCSRWRSLGKLIQEAPEDILGESAARRFSNRLPFLFKVLAASRPLSIQAHPDREQAREGFARENRARIPFKASHRNYRDDNHKPELLCALRPFWALKGFRDMDEILSQVRRLHIVLLEKELNNLPSWNNCENLKILFGRLLNMAPSKKEEIIEDTVQRCAEHALAEPAMGWVLQLHRAYPQDIGVLCPLLMNLVRLNPGEGIYISPGELHAYLEGVGIELMANSDNVLRTGLTEKHIEVEELLSIADFHPKKIEILKPESSRSCESIYSTPVEEFLLSVISVAEGLSYESARSRSVEIMICTEGTGSVTDLQTRETLFINRGTALLIPAALEQYRVAGEATIYKASVPM
jgi:mannose-6-phosphate isomerase